MNNEATNDLAELMGVQKLALFKHILQNKQTNSQF